MRRFHQSLTALLVLLLFVTACAPVAPAGGGVAPEAPAALAAGSEVVFFPAQIGSQLREQGYEGIYFLADAGFSPDPKQVPQAEEYMARYAAQYHEEFGALGGAAALTAYIALDAIERCAQVGDVTRACVLEQLKATDLPETPLGIPIQFDENNQVVGSRFFLFQVEDGPFTLLN